LPIIAGLVVIGAFAGLIAGLLGIGGGIVIVPALYYAEELLGVAEAVRMHVAVGTSLAVIVVTSAFSFRAHWRLGAVDFAILRLYGPAVLAGVVIGAGVSGMVSGKVLSAVFGLFALAVALNMATGKPNTILGARLPGPWAVGSYGALTGAVSTMAGIGGGAMTIAMLTLYSVPIRSAVGTASAVGAVIALPGAVGFAVIGWGVGELPPASLGYVSLAGFAVIAPVTALVAPLGARLADRLPRRWLARVFALLLGAAALRMLSALVV
jgi:uncharacterized membrane protein YfcA